MSGLERAVIAGALPSFRGLPGDQAILGLGLFFPAQLFRRIGCWDNVRICLSSLAQYFLILLMICQQLLLMEARSYKHLLIPFLVHVKKELEQRFGPGLIAYFMNEDEFPKNMGIASELEMVSQQS